MAATLTINLKDNATPGLQELEQQLVRTSDATGEVAADTRQLTVAQQEQIKVIHEHRAAWSQLAVTVGPALVSLAKGAGAVGLAYWQMRRQEETLAASKRIATAAGMRLAGVITGLGPILTGAALGAKGFEFALHRTGIELDRSSELAKLNEQAIGSLRAQVVNSGEDWETWAVQNRELLEEMGVSITTNYDRVAKASAKLGQELGRPFRDAVTYGREWVGDVNLLGDAWEWFDGRVTEAAKNIEQNAGAVGKAHNRLADQGSGKLSELFGGESADEVGRQLSAYRELADAQAKLAEKQDKSFLGFERLRETHQGFEQSRRAAAEAQRLASLETLAQIDAEINRQKDLAGQKAAAGRFDEDAQKGHAAVLNQLEQQRTQIVRAEAEKQKRLRKEIREETERREKESLQRRIDAENDALRRSVEAYNQWAADVRAARKRADDFAREYADTANNAILENLITRLEAEGDQAETAHRARRELIQQETDQRIAAADTQEERERAFYDGLKRLQREDLAHQQRVIRDEVAARKQAADEAVRIEQQKRDELQRLLQQAGAPDAKELLGQIDPRKALMDQRGKAAADAARRRVLEDPDNQRLRAEALTSVGASSRLRRMQEAAARQAEREARAGAGRAFNRGEVDPRELSQAQQQAGQQMLQTLQQNGQLSGDVVQVLQQQLQAAADQQGTLAVLQQQVAQLQRASQAIGNGAAAQRQRAQRGGV